MGHDRLAASSCVRVSFGHTTTEADIDAFLQALPGAYEKAKKAGYTLI
jgi:cysteine desulfurase